MRGVTMRYGVMPAVLAGVLTTSVASAQDKGGFWAGSPKSMSEYLNEGYRISSHTYDSYSNGTNYTFVLARDNRSVICYVWTQNRKDPETHCRLLN